MFDFFDFGLIEWWAGLNRGLRLGLALAVALTGGLIWLLGGAGVWWVSLVVVGVLFLIAAIEIKDG